MYCNNCGAHLPEGTKFCKNCGTDTELAAQPAKAQYQPEHSAPQQHSGPYQQATPQYSGTQPYTPPPTHYHKRKEPALAVILSWFVMLGSGHIYAGKPGKGIGLFFGGITCIGVTYGGFYFLLIFTYNYYFAMAIMIIGSIGVLILTLYTHIDAYKTANKYNQFLQINGRPPTSNDNW
jgi:TM2 domain-containing membrane protein YozV